MCASFCHSAHKSWAKIICCGALDNDKYIYVTIRLRSTSKKKTEMPVQKKNTVEEDDENGEEREKKCTEISFESTSSCASPASGLPAIINSF